MLKHCTLQSAFPALGQALPRVALTTLPTIIRSAIYPSAHGSREILIKDDSQSATLYGGNKVRKLEYLLARALAKERNVVATFGAVGSHHALATALYADQLQLRSIAFLSHQTRTADIAATLRLHLQLGTTLVPFGGSYAARIATLREQLRGQRTMIIPAGGSSWLGNVAFIDAAFELAGQIARGECPRPDRLYVATGTMGTAIGLALGLALCELPVEVHAVRITPAEITDDTRLQRLANKTALMLNRLDAKFPRDLARRMQLVLRHDFYGAGYAHTDAATQRAIAIGRDELGLQLEATYTGKAMAALLHDLDDRSVKGMTPLFWQSYHAAPLPVAVNAAGDLSALPAEFSRYLS
ncbi:MAG: pyridoxal-phosphate dependent enzyme [Woeseia sp.]